MKSDLNTVTHRPQFYSVEAKGDLLETVFNMRYRSYHAEGYIAQNDTGKFIDEYDALPNSASYLMYYKDEPIGSIRTSIFDPTLGIKIPAMDVFFDEIKEHCGFDKPLVEANKFVIDPIFKKYAGIKARFNLFRNITNKANEVNAGSILAAVRPEHIGFYRSLHFCHTSSIAKDYTHLSFKTMLLVCRDIYSGQATLENRFLRC